MSHKTVGTGIVLYLLHLNVEKVVDDFTKQKASKM
jgi:hypothetical protein